jgi:hypothetical protein
MIRLAHSLRLMLLLAACCAMAGCSLYRNDRCWVPEEQYLIARELFVQTGSLDLVRQRLEEYEWRRCRINETIYRLGKEFEVLPEELPGATPDPVATPTPAP